DSLILTPCHYEVPVRLHGNAIRAKKGRTLASSAPSGGWTRDGGTITREGVHPHDAGTDADTSRHYEVPVRLHGNAIRTVRVKGGAITSGRRALHDNCTGAGLGVHPHDGAEPIICRHQAPVSLHGDTRKAAKGGTLANALRRGERTARD